MQQKDETNLLLKSQTKQKLRRSFKTSEACVREYERNERNARGITNFLKKRTLNFLEGSFQMFLTF